jgi:hypothetical protein
MSSTELPVELILQIMCDCQDIASVIRLAATNRTMQAAWYSNTTFVVCAVFGVKDEELRATLRLADMDASIVKQEDQAGGLRDHLRAFLRFANTKTSVLKRNRDTGQGAIESDLNATVRRRLIWFQRSAEAVTALTDVMNAEPNGDASHFMRSAVDSPWPDQTNSADYWQSYIKIRQLAIGYDHTQHLATAYEYIHGSSKQQIRIMYIMSLILSLYSLQDKSTPLRSATPRAEHLFQISGTGLKWNFWAPWPFVYRVILAEMAWCEGRTMLGTCMDMLQSLQTCDGDSKVALMLGAHTTPWECCSRRELRR